LREGLGRLRTPDRTVLGRSRTSCGADMSDFDAIVIGSGFGGAITACRLAEGGYSVLVLERGRRWDPTNFPRAATDPWVWDDTAPLARNGWFDFRVFPNMTVVQGAGVG